MKKTMLARQSFINTYNIFDHWLLNVGFRLGRDWKESSTPLDCHYAEYDKYFETMYSVEHYVHAVLGFSMRFIRDNYNHRFIVIWETTGFFSHLHLISLKNFKKDITKLVNDLKVQRSHELLAIKI